ncbi:phosphatase PAP2 family protein [Pseudonocardia sp. WMMC193]|uniref:phosphatase PAP2 family protein n=1 Tax=Pseudonocardia sp. WMMC193 TaxID=2911965 RepID=UPI001F256A54|nr:phosphatase PAP2 family protein [Pseudonocardia sp. WMMC193]MCF7553866.1 phosphatase PAP2 family protein [Pseudonocardia sp. WMMC193]
MTTTRGTAGGRPATDGRRQAFAALALAAAAVVVALGVHVAGGSAAGRLDGRVTAAVDTLTSPHVWTVRELTTFGSPPFVVAAALVLAVVALALRERLLALLALAGPGLTGLTIMAMKPVVGRTLGADGGHAYPSGHTGGATSVALVVGLLLLSRLRVSTGVAVAALLAFALVAGGVVGGGMVAIGAHYPTDTVGGFGTAVAVVLGLAAAADLVAERLRTRTEGPAGEAGPSARP